MANRSIRKALPEIKIYTHFIGFGVMVFNATFNNTSVISWMWHILTAVSLNNIITPLILNIVEVFRREIHSLFDVYEHALKFIVECLLYIQHTCNFSIFFPKNDDILHICKFVSPTIHVLYDIRLMYQQKIKVYHLCFLLGKTIENNYNLSLFYS